MKQRSRALGLWLAEREIEIDDLDPRHRGLRIAHLTDIHCGRMTPAEHIRAAIELARSAEPDLFLMTGDYVCWRRREADLARQLLAGLEPGKVYATLGNHDYYASGHRVAAALAVNGYRVLRNQSHTAMVRGAPLHIVGIDDPVTKRHDLDRAFSGVGRGTQIALCHCPEQLEAIAERGAHLVLSGHTHGGQINWRGIADRLGRRVGKRYVSSGLYRHRRTTLHLSAGIGYSGVRLRAGRGTRAEVALLVLRDRRPESPQAPAPM